MAVFVAGMGVITGLGMGVDENFSKLSSCLHGINNYASEIDPFLEGIPVAKIKKTNTELAEKYGVSHNWPLTALLSLVAVQEALASANIDISAHKSGFISATTVGGMDLTEEFFKKYIFDNQKGNKKLIRNHSCGSVTDLVASAIGVNSYVNTINTACSSSANSIILAARLIENGMLDIAIAGGADALTAFTLNGFNTLQLLDNDLCLSFDARRKGLNMGEGAGYIVLVSEKMIQEHKCNKLCKLSGFSNTTDAFHQTALSPTGDGPFRSMDQALKMAQLLPGQISYINLHGTATPNNDLAEGSAIVSLFGKDIPVSSTKSFTGHTLGASGGVEAVFSILSLTRNQLLPNLRFQEVMPETNLKPIIFPESKTLNHVLSNSFGFGGNCSSLIFSKY